MCYAVFIIQRICHGEHIIEATAAWRQCREAAEASNWLEYEAEESSETNVWMTLCKDREAPQSVDELVKITSLAEGDPDNMAVEPCPCCASIQSDSDVQDIMTKLNPMREAESERAHAIETLEKDIKEAFKKLKGRTLDDEVHDLRLRQQVLSTANMKSRLTQEELEKRLHPIVRVLQEQHDEYIQRKALARLTKKPEGIYFGPVEQIEKEEEPNYHPVDLPDGVSQKDFPFFIVAGEIADFEKSDEDDENDEVDDEDDEVDRDDHNDDDEDSGDDDDDDDEYDDEYDDDDDDDDMEMS